MAFNVKTRLAQALWQVLQERPAGQRHGTTGFWLASLERVRSQGVVRVADLPSSRFVFEADIDPEGTHVMSASRMSEYLEHFRIRTLSGQPLEEPPDATIHRCLAQGRIVVVFRSARPHDGPMNHTGQNPVWYT